jgi:RimJ/RimL family protein N-acetyltransferase
MVKPRRPAYAYTDFVKVWFGAMLPIETARLRLRRFVPGDVAALHAIHSRADVTRWLFWDPRSEDEVRASIEGHIARPLEQGAVLAIDLDGTLIGTVNVAVGESRQGDLGFMLHPDHQGHGYATEAASAMLEFAFGSYDLHRVSASVEPRNAASVRVLERLGMRKEAHLLENDWVKGEWSSEAIYAILAREWRERRGWDSTPRSA